MIDPLIQQVFAGRSNATGVVTLKASATSTTVNPTDASNPGAQNVAANSRLFLFPVTAHAAAELGNGTCFVALADISKQQFKVTHASNNQTDRTFFYVSFYPPVG